MRLELHGIDEHLNLAIRAAERLRHGCTLHAGDLITHLKLREVLQLRFV